MFIHNLILSIDLGLLGLARFVFLNSIKPTIVLVDSICFKRIQLEEADRKLLRKEILRYLILNMENSTWEVSMVLDRLVFDDRDYVVNDTNYYIDLYMYVHE